MTADDKAPTLQILLNRAEAALALSISEKQVQLLTAPRGPLQPTRIGRRVLYSTDSLRQFVRTAEGAAK